MRLRTSVLLAALVPLLSGCATLRSTIDGWSTGADGLSRPQRRLRDALATGDFPTALAWQEDDALLRALTSGIATYYAAQYARSAALLDTAVLLSDQRMTSSVSRNTLALVTNDMARPYTPRRTERLFVPYYAMLAYVQLDQWEDAAVEARRMVSLLAQFGADRDEGERALHAGMHYLAGAVFERAGERDASAVAYRNAHALADAYPERPARAAGEGEVLVVVERGFVAHRATETIRIALGDDDREGLRGDERSRHRVVDRIGARLGWASSLTQLPGFEQKVANATGNVGVGPASPAPTSSSIDSDDDDGDDDIRHLAISFPSLRRSPRPWAGAPHLAEDSVALPAGAIELQLGANVDDASAVDERRERASLVVRELTRAAAKYAVTKAAHDKGGEVAGKIAEIGSSLLERADVRSWHLLPQELVLIRARLPEGQHRLRVAVGEGASLRQVDLGPVTVRRGAVALLPARLWREPAPAHGEYCGHRSHGCRD